MVNELSSSRVLDSVNLTPDELSTVQAGASLQGISDIALRDAVEYCCKALAVRNLSIIRDYEHPNDNGGVFMGCFSDVTKLIEELNSIWNQHMRFKDVNFRTECCKVVISAAVSLISIPLLLASGLVIAKVASLVLVIITIGVLVKGILNLNHKKSAQQKVHDNLPSKISLIAEDHILYAQYLIHQEMLANKSFNYTEDQKKMFYCIVAKLFIMFGDTGICSELLAIQPKMRDLEANAENIRKDQSIVEQQLKLWSEGGPEFLSFMKGCTHFCGNKFDDHIKDKLSRFGVELENNRYVMKV